jgi:hypothetical protein
MRYIFRRQPLPAHDRTAVKVSTNGTSYTMFYRGSECVAVVMTSLLAKHA